MRPGKQQRGGGGGQDLPHQWRDCGRAAGRQAGRDVQTWLVCSGRGAAVETIHEFAQVDVLALSEWRQEPALLFVQDLDGRHLGGPAGICRADQKRPAVSGMPLPDDESPVLEVVDERSEPSGGSGTTARPTATNGRSPSFPNGTTPAQARRTRRVHDRRLSSIHLSMARAGPVTSFSVRDPQADGPATPTPPPARRAERVGR
jgi:hypothetical protein